MAAYVDFVKGIVWGAPMLALILGTGLFLSLRTGFVQLTLLPRALKLFLARLRQGRSPDGVSSFQALCTALAATVGTGNLVGVAGAIALGGPGAVFWMWVCALLGMMTKFAEATLAVRYRTREAGEYVGGPMQMICAGLGSKWRPLALCYSLFGVIAAFGVGNATQINAVITSVNQVIAGFGIAESPRRNLGMGLLLAVAIGVMLLGGAGRIGRTAELLVPFASAAYLLLCAAVLILNIRALPAAFAAIIRGAFRPEAVTGGVIGSAFQALRTGVSRGVFTNEAGMGTASIAHAGADVRHPVEQGLMGIVEVFLDTIVICTMTALVILSSGAAIPYGSDTGAALTAEAFSRALGGWSTVVLALAMCCFAFATVLGWGLYGTRCTQFLFGSRAAGLFALLQSAMVAAGAVLQTGTVWSLAETVNGLMAVPNLIALVMLSPELRRLTVEYQSSCGPLAAGGTYESFHQRKPLPAFSHEKVPSPGSGGKKAG